MLNPVVMYKLIGYSFKIGIESQIKDTNGLPN